MQGFKGALIFNLRLEDCVFENVAEPSIVRHVHGAVWRNVRISGKQVGEVS